MTWQEIVTFIAPLLSGSIVTVIIPSLIKRFTVKKLEKKIEEIDENSQLQDIKRELREIKKEILEMRGKVK